MALLAVYVEDEPITARSIRRLLEAVLGPSIGLIHYNGLRDMRAGGVFSANGIVLVTDGSLGDGTCLQVVEEAAKKWGLPALHGTVLLLSGDAPPVWNQELDAMRTMGLEPERLTKPTSKDDLDAWWEKVRSRFGI